MTRKSDTAAELPWDHAVHDIPQAGLSTVREAAPDERARIAEALDLVCCTELKAEYAISPAGNGRYRENAGTS